MFLFWFSQNSVYILMRQLQNKIWKKKWIAKENCSLVFLLRQKCETLKFLLKYKLNKLLPIRIFHLMNFSIHPPHPNWDLTRRSSILFLPLKTPHVLQSEFLQNLLYVKTNIWMLFILSCLKPFSNHGMIQFCCTLRPAACTYAKKEQLVPNILYKLFLTIHSRHHLPIWFSVLTCFGKTHT